MRRNNRMAKRQKNKSKKLKLLSLGGILAVLMVGIFGSHLLASTESAEASFARDIQRIERKISEIYIEGEEDVDLAIYEENESLDGKIQNLITQSEIEEESEKLQELATEWEIVMDMAFVKNELEKRKKEGELITDAPLPTDFISRLNSLKDIKPVFYENYLELYEKYKEILDDETEESDDEGEYAALSVEELEAILFIEEGVINWNLTDEDLNLIYYRFEELGASDLGEVVIVELARRQAERDENENLSSEAKEDLDTSSSLEENIELDENQNGTTSEELRVTEPSSPPLQQDPSSDSAATSQSPPATYYNPPATYAPVPHSQSSVYQPPTRGQLEDSSENEEATSESSEGFENEAWKNPEEESGEEERSIESSQQSSSDIEN